MKKNQKVCVSDTTKHQHNRNRIGYFQFYGGKSSDCAVCTVEPTTKKDSSGTYFSVSKNEITAVI